MNNNQPRAFTMVEVVIVAAILGILVALSIPKYMIAQVHAKITQNIHDMRILAEALGAYRLEHGVYPPWRQSRVLVNEGDPLHPNIIRFYRLTTPIAYLEDIPLDPFINYEEEEDYQQWGEAYDYTEATNGDNEADPHAWGHLYRINGWGPDGINSYAGGRDFTSLEEACPNGIPRFVYAPSNGLVSYGDILWVGPKGGPFVEESYCDIKNGY